MNDQKIQSLILEWQEEILKVSGIHRSYEDEILGSMGSLPIKIITGFRRSGKSYLVKRISKALYEQNKFALKNILYINFENFEFSFINSPEDLDKVFKVFLNTVVSQEEKKLVIFDEIQNVRDWDKFIRTIYEKYQDVEIILTGSNSELLSSELGTNLAGRFIEFSILPFSFREFLKYHDLEINTEEDYIRNKNAIIGFFDKYVKYGSLPEVFLIEDERAKYSYIEGVLSKVILDDIIQRFKIKKPSLLEKTLQYLISNIGNITSFSKLKKHAQKLDFKTDEDTLVNYTSYFIKSFALFEVHKFDWKLNKVFNTSKKYFSIDLGIANLYMGLAKNYSNQLENIVFLQLKRNKQIKDIYYGYSANKEIDFITQSRDDIFTKYQVTQELHEDNLNRELSPFTLTHEDHLGEGENILLTLDDAEEELSFKDTSIKKVNLMKWLLLT